MYNCCPSYVIYNMHCIRVLKRKENVQSEISQTSSREKLVANKGVSVCGGCPDGQRANMDGVGS